MSLLKQNVECWKITKKITPKTELKHKKLRRSIRTECHGGNHFQDGPQGFCLCVTGPLSGLQRIRADLRRQPSCRRTACGFWGQVIKDLAASATWFLGLLSQGSQLPGYEDTRTALWRGNHIILAAAPCRLGEWATLEVGPPAEAQTSWSRDEAPVQCLWHSLFTLGGRLAEQSSGKIEQKKIGEGLGRKWPKK